MAEITSAQQIRMNLLAMLGYGTAAAKEAIQFVQDDDLKYQMFVQQYNRVTTENTYVAKAMKAIQESTEALTLFDTATELPS
ncbi:DUF2560 family protein [Klebsiella pneumoniae]|uniref:DUF2560 family protein n=1 Tax=Klebsiella pneumoniae TaxID=573 RepID=UPI000D59F953|nr:DUF2560 family protein [Klebsiella pneumoniae]EKJ7338122.1 DUF2560 family protein [Klebsiella pneumoniae]EKX6498161.1 DUF2560 family protein [Klebsiella pneumoniae]EKX6681387.1 DUF2560 family protein [Klebsiella pneumoniae]EKY1372564.1 DUF2560 family protein [Klebsiella pneumoniae]ELA0961405.1 DUF2560 family protein [Klebsiella pneumoniae]